MAETAKSFRVLLTPHRSLSRQGFLAVMGAIAALNLIGGTVFWLLGAWPVVGFMGLDVLLIWWAFQGQFCRRRRAERIEVTDHELILERLAHGRAAEREPLRPRLGLGRARRRPRARIDRPAFSQFAPQAHRDRPPSWALPSANPWPAPSNKPWRARISEQESGGQRAIHPPIFGIMNMIDITSSPARDYALVKQTLGLHQGELARAAIA